MAAERLIINRKVPDAPWWGALEFCLLCLSA